MDIGRQVTELTSMDFDAPDFHSSGYQRALHLAQSIIAGFEADPSRRDSVEPRAFSTLLVTIQRLAFIDPDHGSEPFLADWCERQWASRLQSNPYDADSHLGLARSWLLKAQPSLARVEHTESGTGRSSSSSSGSINNNSTGSGSPRTVRRAANDADRTDSPDYVEARDMLRPALEHVDRALSIQNRGGRLRGPALELAAEIYIHFGNVSDPRNNETSYQRALHCLLLVSSMSDYSMDVHLRGFLDANVDYITDESPPWYTQIEISV